jgi:APA family basic amino acid/polyamine antiporter
MPGPHDSADAGGPGRPHGSLPDRLRREIGLFDATLVAAGSVIGVGIFTTSGFVAASLPHPGLLLLAWLAGGLISLAGALTNAEMGASMPHAGGDYVYLREAFHPLAGFVAGWLTFFAVFCGTVGTLAAGFAEYAGGFVPALSPAHEWWRAGPLRFGPGQLSALGAVWVCTAICISGVRQGARFQSALTAAKLAAIALLCLVGPLFGHGDASGLVRPAPVATELGAFGLARAGALAMVPILFTYLGWNAPVYIASELRDPARTLPRALVLGTLICAGVYLLLNAVYLYAVPVEQMFELRADGSRQGIVRIAELAAERLFGGVGGALVSALVLLSIAGCLQATVLVGARIVYAMALDRTLPAALAEVHADRGTPVIALLVQAGVATLLLVSGSFEQILVYTTFAVITLMACDGVALYRLRARADLPRPYRVWGYPWVPAIYVAAALGLWLNTLVERPFESLLGVAIAAAAIPAYLASRRSRGR